MYYDFTLKITPKIMKDAQNNDRFSLIGHLGTHFDVMDKEFPLDYLRLPAIVINVSTIHNRDIQVEDIDIDTIQEGMFVAFYTGYVHEYSYGNLAYFKNHIQLSHHLIHLLIEKKIKIIGIDCAGIRHGQEHTKTDQYCADHDIFVVENMDGMDLFLNEEKQKTCFINTYTVSYTGITGLPCRVIGEIE